MECEKVQDRFSSLLENELDPSEEKIIREHLSSCSKCQKDYEQFDKTIHWLNSVGEIDVPEGFLSGIYKKMEDRKRAPLVSEKIRLGWFQFPASFKIPIQAMAMVTLVFLVFYITKMMPVETPRLKDAGQTLPPILEEKRMESTLQESPPQTVEQSKTPTPSPPFSPPQEPETKEKVLMARRSLPLPAKPPREIIVRVSDREKILFKLHELVVQYGGEIVKSEGNLLFTSLPVATFSEFEKELMRLDSAQKEERSSSTKDAVESLSATAGEMRQELKGKGEGSVRSETDQESRIGIQILLLQE